MPLTAIATWEQKEKKSKQTKNKKQKTKVRQ